MKKKDGGKRKKARHLKESNVGNVLLENSCTIVWNGKVLVENLGYFFIFLSFSKL